MNTTLINKVKSSNSAYNLWIYFIKKILKFHPMLGKSIMWYVSKPRRYSCQSIRLMIMPQVFHPGLFFSTKVLLQYVRKNIVLEKINVLELGAGSGLISFYCAKMGANVTASDINKVALESILLNAKDNKLSVKIVESDLLNNLNVNEFDLILINPPYYPKNANNETELAWFCGSNFEYFRKLFFQLQEKRHTQNQILMILSDDCQISTIEEIANLHSQQLVLRRTIKTWAEYNFIFSIEQAIQ